MPVLGKQWRYWSVLFKRMLWCPSTQYMILSYLWCECKIRICDVSVVSASALVPAGFRLSADMTLTIHIRMIKCNIVFCLVLYASVIAKIMVVNIDILKPYLWSSLKPFYLSNDVIDQHCVCGCSGARRHKIICRHRDENSFFCILSQDFTGMFYLYIVSPCSRIVYICV